MIKRCSYALMNRYKRSALIQKYALSTTNTNDIKEKVVYEGTFSNKIISLRRVSLFSAVTATLGLPLGTRMFLL